jgi:hypothetical protein
VQGAFRDFKRENGGVRFTRPIGRSDDVCSLG